MQQYYTRQPVVAIHAVGSTIFQWQNNSNFNSQCKLSISKMVNSNLLVLDLWQKCQQLTIYKRLQSSKQTEIYYLLKLASSLESPQRGLAIKDYNHLPNKIQWSKNNLHQAYQLRQQYTIRGNHNAPFLWSSYTICHKPSHISKNLHENHLNKPLKHQDCKLSQYVLSNLEIK